MPKDEQRNSHISMHFLPRTSINNGYTFPAQKHIYVNYIDVHLLDPRSYLGRDRCKMHKLLETSESLKNLFIVVFAQGQIKEKNWLKPIICVYISVKVSYRAAKTAYSVSWQRSNPSFVTRYLPLFWWCHEIFWKCPPENLYSSWLLQNSGALWHLW